MKEKFKILLIEDEEFLGDLLCKKLQGREYDVDWVGEGKKGLKKAKMGGYDLIILDMILPKLDGFDILEDLQNSGNNIPIIIISNSGQPVDIKKAKKMGAIDYLVKSDFGPRDVLAKIRRNFGGPEKDSSGEKRNEGKKNSSKKKKKEDKVILLIEDDEFLSNLITKKIKDYGYNIETAMDGDKGWNAVKKKKPDLVLLDIIMPGMDGFKVLENIKKSKDKEIANIPVLMLTNLGEHKNAEKARKIGAEDYILKATFSTDDILKKVGYYLGE